MPETTPPSAAQLRRTSWLRWSSYALLIVAYMLGYFHRMAPAVLSGELQAAFQTSGAALGILAAAYFYSYTAMQIPAGVLADTWGARRIVALGTLLAGLGALIFGLAETLWLAGFGRFLVGMGVSVIFIAILKFTAHWFFDHQFATVTGMTIMLGNVGALSAATPLSWALEVASWRGIMLALAGVSLLSAALIWLVVRDRPGDAGLPSMRALEGKPEHSAIVGGWRQGLLAVLKNPATWPGFFTSLGLGGIFFTLAGLWGVPFLRDVQGLDRIGAAHHATALILGFAFGSLAIGLISDWLGKRKPVFFAFVLCFAVCWAPVQLTIALPFWASLTQFFLLGFFATAYTISLSATKEVNPPALSGMATGVVNTGTFLGVAIMQPVIGHIMDLGWDGRLAEGGVRLYSAANYQLGFIAMSVFLVISVAFATRLRETHCRNIYS